MPQLDLRPATQEVTRLLDGVRPAHLAGPTPCPGYSVAALLDHLMALTRAFTLAAGKSDSAELAAESPPGQATAGHLDPSWRIALPQRLEALAAAWRDPSAWQGEAEVAGVPLSGEAAGLVALDEVVLHGWDLAQSTGQTLHPDAAHVDAVLSFAEMTAQPDQAQLREGLFGPVLPIAAEASQWNRALSFAGRDPAWAPAPR